MGEMGRAVEVETITSIYILTLIKFKHFHLTFADDVFTIDSVT